MFHLTAVCLEKHHTSRGEEKNSVDAVRLAHKLDTSQYYVTCKHSTLFPYAHSNLLI